MTKDELLPKLQEGQVILSFLKKDKTERIMRCTLHTSVIPKVVGESKKYDHLITVWDLDKDAWRSVNLTAEVRILECDTL